MANDIPSTEIGAKMQQAHSAAIGINVRLAAMLDGRVRLPMPAPAAPTVATGFTSTVHLTTLTSGLLDELDLTSKLLGELETYI